MGCENAEDHEGCVLGSSMTTRDSEHEVAADRVCGGELRPLGGLVEEDLIEQDSKVRSLAHLSAVGMDLPRIGEAPLQGPHASTQPDPDPAEQHGSKLRHHARSPPQTIIRARKMLGGRFPA